MSDGDLFDAVKPDDDAKRPEPTEGETLFDDRTAPGDDLTASADVVAETSEAAEVAGEVKIVDATPKPKEPAKVREIPVEPVPPRPSQALPHASCLGA